MINKRQYNILSFFMSRSLFLGGGLSMLVNLSRNEVVLSGILGMLLGYFLLFLYFKKGITNKYFNVLVALGIILINSLANTVLTSTYLLFSTPTLLILLLFFITLIFSVKKDFKVIGRFCEIVIGVASFFIILALIGLFPLIDTSKMLPLFKTPLLNVFKGILVFCGASILPNILLINYKGDLKFKEVSLGYIFGSMLMIIVLFLIISIYGSNFASIARFPEFLILKKINLMGYFNNLENLLVTEWMINILISGFISLKVLKDNLNGKLFYLSIGLIILVSELYLNKNYVNILYIKNYFYYIAFIFSIIGLVGKRKKVS